MQLPFYSSLEEVYAEAAMCRACGRADQRQQVVMGAGDPNADLMLIAEYPSQTDDSTGHPYTGPAGEYLDELLAFAGTDRSSIYITNVVRCYATESGRRGDRIKPSTRTEQHACSTWTSLEIQFVRPRVILALGAPPARVLIDESFELTEQRGTWMTRPDGVEVTATFQPAYAMRMKPHDPDRAREIESHLINDIRAAVARSNATPPE